MRILVIEDDRLFAQTLKETLVSKYIVDLAHTGEEGCAMATCCSYDLCIIDLHLPDIDGREVCRMVRGISPNVPIIFVTGEVETRFKVSSLDAGADDYITKPIQEPELMARIRAIMRRTKDLPDSGSFYSYRNLHLDPKSRRCKLGDTSIELSKKEFDILLILVRNNNKTVSRRRLTASVWQSYENMNSNVLDVYISRIRKKLPSDIQIKAAYSDGYIIK